jgi:glucose/arabinose dehydrogenase
MARAGLLVAALTAVAVACGPGSGSPTPRLEPAPTNPSPGAPSTAPTGSPAPPTPGGSAGPPAAASFDPSVRLSLELVTDLPGKPLAVVAPPDGSGRLVVAEQGGRAWLVRDGAAADQPFLDVSDRTEGVGERGLLGIAFHPDFPADPRVFVDYTDRNGDTVVSSFTVSERDPDRVEPDSERVLLGIDQPFPNHNGGGIVFGPDGYLYVAMGDGGSGGDPMGNGQRLDTLLGKILRIDVDHAEGATPYAIPPDNPFVGQAGARPEIWLYGLRNPWRIGFDRATGDLWIGDVGQNAWEEIDVTRGGTGGTNYGWARMEGFHCFPAGSTCDQTGLALPVAEYGHDAGCSVIGGLVYRGEAAPRLAGGYVFSDVCSGTLWLLDAANDGPQTPIVAGESGRAISSFGEDEAGELYATDLGGALLRVVVAN